MTFMLVCEQIQKAEQIIDTIESYLKIRWEK